MYEMQEGCKAVQRSCGEGVMEVIVYFLLLFLFVFGGLGVLMFGVSVKGLIETALILLFVCGLGLLLGRDD